jgi:hypothetical protein
MNFVTAFLWMALLLSIGLFVYLAYVVIKEGKDDKEQKDEKDDPDPEKKTKGTKPVPFPVGKKITVNADPPGTNNNGVQVSNIRDSHIEVNNINNCPFNSGVIGNNQVAEEEEQIISDSCQY